MTLSGSFVLGTAATYTAGSHSLATSTFNVGNGIFTAPSSTLTVGSTFSISGGTFNHNDGIIMFSGTTSAGITCGGTGAFNQVAFQHTSGTKTVQASCNLPLGNDPTVTNNVTVNGTLSGSGTLHSTGGTLLLNAVPSLSGFSGIDVDSTLTINGAGANVNFGAYTFVELNVFNVQNNAIFTAPSGVMTVGGGFTIGAGSTFNHNNGTVVFGISGATITCNNAVFNHVEFQHTTNLKTVSAGCNLPLGNNPSVGRITVNGTLSGSGTLNLNSSSGNIFNAGGTLSGFDGLVVSSSMTVSGANLDLSSYTTVDFNNAFTLSSGSFTAPAMEMSVSGTFNLTGSGVFNHNNGTLVFDGSSTATITCNNTAFNLVRFVNTSNTKTISTGCDLPLGHDPDVTRSIVLNGTLSGTGILNFSSANLTLNPGSALVGFDGLYVAVDFTLANNTTFDAGNYSPFDVDRTFILNSGSVFTAPSGEMSVAGSFTINSGATFNHNNGTLVFDGSASAAVTCSVPTIFNQVVINKSLAVSSDFFRINSGCDLPLGTDPIINFGEGLLRLEGELSGSGTLTAPTGTFKLYEPTSQLTGFSGLHVNNFQTDDTVVLADFSAYDTFDVDGFFHLQSGSEFSAPPTMTVARGFAVEPGATFTANDGTVFLDGTDQTLTGDITFYNLTKTTPAAATLTFTDSSTITTEGSLILEGADASNLLSLVSSTPGSQWNIDGQGSRTLQYLSVQDSNNINASAMLAYDSQDLGNNVNWQFLLSPLPPNPTNPGADPNEELAETGEGRVIVLVVAGVGIAVGLVFFTLFLRRQKR